MKTISLLITLLFFSPVYAFDNPQSINPNSAPTLPMTLYLGTTFQVKKIIYNNTATTASSSHFCSTSSYITESTEGDIIQK